ALGAREAARDDCGVGRRTRAPRGGARARTEQPGGAVARCRGRRAGRRRRRTGPDSAAGAEGVHGRRGAEGSLFRLRQVRRPPGGREDPRRQRGVAQIERRQPRAHRRPLRRARYQRVQPGARRAAREGDDELSCLPGHPGQPHHHHQLRRGAAGLHGEDRGVLGQEPPRKLSRQAALGSRSVLPAMRGLGLLVALSLAGCAEMQEATGVATQQDLLQLRQEMMAAQSAQRGKSDADSISAQVDKRVREQTTEHDRQVATLTRQIDSLNDTVTTLSGRVDDLKQKLDTVKHLLRGAAAPGAGPATTAPRRSAGASGAPAGGTTPGASTATPASPAPGPVAAVPPRPTTGALQPQDIYQAAYIDFSKGSYSLAIAGFREFLRRYPDHELAGSAQYWIGEAYLALARGFT